jgi:hypothetical protein
MGSKASWAQAIVSASAAVVAIVALLQPADRGAAEDSYELNSEANREIVADLDEAWDAIHNLQLADAREAGAREARSRRRTRESSSRALSAAVEGGSSGVEVVEEPVEAERRRPVKRARKSLSGRVNLPERLPDPAGAD